MYKVELTNHPLIKRARLRAADAHRGQSRYGSKQLPYITHPIEVAHLLAICGAPPIQIAAGLLHDTVEDTDFTIELIEAEFGKEVAAIVEGLTDPPSFKILPTNVRKESQAEIIEEASWDVQAPKMADQTSNLRSIVYDPPAHWNLIRKQDYIKGAHKVASLCSHSNPELWQYFMRTYYKACLIYFNPACQ